MANITLTKVQHDLLVKLSIYAIILIISAAVTIYLKGAVDDYEKKYTWLQNDINDLGRKLDGLNKKTLEFSEAVRTWEGLGEEEKKLQGLRINDAKDMLDKLQTKYKFSSVKTSFSKPEEINGDYKTDTVGMVSSIITMSFNALSDEYIFSFINDLMINFPGYVQIKSVSINKPTTITKEILKKISMGEEVAIMPATLEFYWHDLKYKGPTNPVAPAGGMPPK